MKVANKEKERTDIPFDEVSYGKVFEYNGVLWLKCYYEPEDKAVAVCLRDWEIDDGFIEEIVEVKNVKLQLLD
jgi:hypothetical protein